MNFGEQIQQLRKSKKMSQETLAKKVGVSRQSISKWENGAAYPEMKHIMKLCSIFHCQITDLVHGQLSDLNEMNYEIKENVVKLKRKKQKYLKRVSQVIVKMSKMLKIFILMAIMFIVVLMFASPFIWEKVEFNQNEIVFIEEKTRYNEIDDTYYRYYTNSALQFEKETIEARLINQLEVYSKSELIIGSEILLILSLIYMICFYWLCEDVQYLFKNISSKNTPFTFINMIYVKHVTKYLLISFICHTCIGILINLFIVKTFIFNIDIMQIIYILCLVCLSYIFEYGYEIQLDSNGVIYEEA